MGGHKGTTHIHGTCAICKHQDVTSYHYRKAHGLIPKMLFTYDDKMWRCRQHLVKSPNPHTMMAHYWRDHAHSHAKSLPYKTREPRGISPTLTEETPVSIISSAQPLGQIKEAISSVVANPSDNPPITAEAIVAAFEDRVRGIDELLAEKDKELHRLHAVISKLNAQLADTYKKHQAEIDNVKAQREQIDARADGLVARLFKR